MIGDEMYFSDLAHTLQNISKDEKAVFVSGLPGSGKTFTALQFCAEHKESLYFSFKATLQNLLKAQQKYGIIE